MNFEITELIAAQAKTVAVMAGAGVLVECLWQFRKRFVFYAKPRLAGLLTELAFWVLSAVVISSFMYYGSYGRITSYGCIAFFAGLLLWKKICCIISPWESKDEEVQNLKITARSSTSKRPEKKGRKKERRSGKKKNEKPATKPVRKHAEKGLSENSV